MNSFYDQTAATLKKDYCVGPAHMVDVSIQTGQVDLKCQQIDNITAKELGFLKAQKATMKDCAGDPREITFTVVGMLLDMDIPLVKRGRLNTRNIPFFRQHATIVGLGTEKFEKATCIEKNDTENCVPSEFTLGPGLIRVTVTCQNSSTTAVGDGATFKEYIGPTVDTLGTTLLLFLRYAPDYRMSAVVRAKANRAGWG
ncbi:hypothetical protein C8J57DRAFT_1233029 [Mycena rebaudengoi]|nr:hypothetical protein C8J57DRAFT_1233029 [Mycena rebaudengoi]